MHKEEAVHGGSEHGDSALSLGDPLWQDRELQEDIMAATGLNLQVNKGEKKKGKGKVVVLVILLK